MKCKNCKHWERNTDEYESHELGECHNENFIYNGRGGKDGEVLSLKDKLLYWDCEGYMAIFKTGEEFGCIHFEEKE